MQVSVIRAFRLAAKLSQAEFAERLGVSTETYRAWDSNRRQPSSEALDKARTLATRDDEERLGLPALAAILGVSVYLLRKAARDGRLAVTYGNRTVFGRPPAQATLPAGEAYKAAYYGKRTRWVPRPEGPPVLPTAPPDYDKQLVKIRRRFGLSQAQLAERIGAASKAVVYQWESRKRRPSQDLWRRVLELATPPPRMSAGAPIADQHTCHARPEGTVDRWPQL